MKITIKTKEFLSQEEINKLMEEKRKEYIKQHTAWIYLKNGNTYIGYDVLDYMTKNLMFSLRKLIELMDVKYSIKYPFGDNKSCYIIIEGEDEIRAEFIQKFFDNGYKLTWK